MKIAWLTPYSQNSAIAKFSSLVVEALTARDYSITLVSSDELPLAEYRRPPPAVELLHWSHFGSDPDAASAYDLFVYNIGDHFPNHAGVLSLIDHYPGVCIFHDFYLVNLFLAWCARSCERPAAHCIVSSLYGEKVAKEFWDRGADADFQEWSASHTPMTGWIARKALAAVAHAPFYEPRLTEWCAGPVQVIPLAYTASADALNLQVQPQNEHVRILTVGTVNPNKRVEPVIQTIARSAVLRSRCKYDVVGKIDDKERIRLLSLIDRLGLHDLVHLHGPVSDFELCYRYAEAEIVCCLRWPALEGASASCIEAMSYGKAVIVTDTGFYASIPPDLVVKVKATHESEDLARHLEMLAVDAGARDSLGKRARDWARFEYAPDAYAARIEPLLAATVKEKAAIDALIQIGANLRAMCAEPDEPIVQLIGSEFHSLFCGSEGRINAIKWISDMLQVPASPAEDKQRSDESQPASGDSPEDAPLKSPSGDEESFNRLPPVSESAPDASLKSGPDREERPGEPLPRAAVPAGAWLRRFVGSCTEPIRTRLRRYSLRHFLFRCAEPILSPLRDYFLGDLVNLTKGGHQRILGVEQSVGALREQAVQIQKYIERLALVEQSVEALRQQAVQIRKQTERLARRGDVAILADRLTQLESQFAKANRSIDILTKRNVLVLRNELLARTPYGYLFAPIDDSGIATFLLEGKPWEQEISALLDLILKPGMTFVDIGANVGFHTLHGARAVGLSGAVIAFESAPEVFQSLQRSVHLNGLDAICKCMNLALSSSEERTASQVSAVCGHNSLYHPGDEEKKPRLQVKTARLDSVLIEGQRVDVVKIDVEGAELDVLEGMKLILDNHREIVLIVEYGVSHLKRLGINPADWFRRFFAHGFALFAFDESAETWREVTEQKASNMPSVKAVFVRPGTSQWRTLKQHDL